MPLQRNSAMVLIHDALDLSTWHRERLADKRDWTSIMTFVDNKGMMPSLPVMLGNGDLVWAKIKSHHWIELDIEGATFMREVHAFSDLEPCLTKGLPLMLCDQAEANESGLVIVLESHIDEADFWQAVDRYAAEMREAKDAEGRGDHDQVIDELWDAAKASATEVANICARSMFGPMEYLK